MILSFLSVKIISWYDWMFARDTCVDDIGQPLIDETTKKQEVINLDNSKLFA